MSLHVACMLAKCVISPRKGVTGRGEVPTPTLSALVGQNPFLLRASYVLTKGPPAAVLQDPSLSISPQNCPSQGQFRSLVRPIQVLSNTGSFFTRAKSSVGVRAFSPLPSYGHANMS